MSTIIRHTGCIIKYCLQQLNHFNYLLLTLLQEARLRWLKTLGDTINELNIENDTGLIIKEAHIYYESESFYGDLLHILLQPSVKSKTSFDIDYKVTETESKKIVCTAKTTQVCFNHAKGKVVRIPSNLFGLLDS